MKQALIAALSLFLAMFLLGFPLHAGQCRNLIQQDVHADGLKEDRNSVLIQPASAAKPVKDVPLLLKVGPAVHGMQVTSEIALFKASQVGEGSLPKLHVKSEVNPRAVYGTGKTGQIVRAKDMHVSLVRTLLLPRSAPRSWDSTGATGINKAGDYENTAVVQALVAGGTDVSACDGNGETALTTDGASGYQEPPSVTPLTGTEQSVPTPYG